ncbi:hypothetical protein HHK36_032711 [Tetracentron sinense]|uniref:Aminotransferase-like plant mobile domain-containing protein n=1 Tax=Tetracentron sinense TaxID=13715 RepID=A0A834Y7M0_TETSI|nr:hypothetical protein HHK36_032711 [Tetracentron sinense]
MQRMGREKRSKRYHDSAASSSTAAVSGLEPDADEAQADLSRDEAPVPEVRARRNRRGRRRNDEGDEVLDSGGEPARVEESSDEEISGWGMVPEEYRNIPDTPLLSGLSSHLSVYARPNPGVPTFYSGIRGAWGKAYALCSGVSEDVREQLSTFGFGYFIMIPAFRSDRKWLLALMERWFNETNTFHFPYFEMGITPTDFVMLTGIRFGGMPLRLRRINKARIMDLMGVPPENKAASNKDIFDQGQKVKVVWLRASLVGLDSLTFDDPEFPFVMRRLLLYIFGQCFFPEDRSSVDGRYLQWMDPLDDIGTYDWGSTIYAVILRGLRRVTRLRHHSCRFFSPLLELWAREYLAPFRPHIDDSACTLYYPRSCRWELSSDETQKHLLHKAQEELDRMDFSRITPRPYRGLDPSVYAHPDVIAANNLSKRRVFFSSFLSDEYYLGERMTLQTEGTLHVPADPPSPMTFRFSVRKCMRQMQQRGLPASDFMDLRRDYASWYKGSLGYLLQPIAVRVGATDIGGEAVESYRSMRHLRSAMASCLVCQVVSTAIPSFVGRTDLDDDAPGPSSCSIPAQALGILGVLHKHPTVSRLCTPPFWLVPDAIAASISASEVPIENPQILPNLENHRVFNKDLKSWVHSLDREEQDMLDSMKLGNSPSLLNVELNGYLMEAALACWNPSILVFRFGSTEIAPTLEEYARLLRVSLESDIAMPIFPESYKNKFVRFLGIRQNSLEKLDEEGSFKRCTPKFLIDHFAPRNPTWISTPMYTGKKEEWPKHRGNALALAIAGHLLFPMSYVCIDAALVDIIVQIESGHTFVPMLLAETFRSLNQCSSQRRGFFKGCQSLLQIWLLEHLSFCNPLRSVGLFRQDLIHLHCHFSEPPSSLCRPEEWHARLISSQDNFVWRCLWFHDFKPVLNFPGRNHMILVGLHGSALYAPNRVVRQFGWTQDIPVVDEEICDVVDFSPSSGTLIAQLAKAWKEREVWNAYDDKCEEPLATKEYALWIRQLVEEVPSVSSCKKRKFQQPVAISYIDFIAKERVRHENLIRIAQKEIAELKEQNASLLSENAFLKDKAGTSLSLSSDDATSRAEVASLMEEVVSLRAKRINEHFRYVQAPVGSQEAVILSMNPDLARLRKTLRNLGHVSSDEYD